GQALFQYVDDEGAVHRVGSADVNGWLAEASQSRVTAKHFRTWHGSVLALDLVLAACATQGHVDATSVGAAVARRLGNTPAVCRKAYIHPGVLELAETLNDAGACQALLARSWVDRPAASPGLTLPERRLMSLLRRRRAT